jgi:hypothetical protein
LRLAREQYHSDCKGQSLSALLSKRWTWRNLDPRLQGVSDMYTLPNRGLFLVERRLANKPGRHVGILDVGNTFQQQRLGWWSSVVYQYGPTGITFEDLTAYWTTIKPITDVAGAVSRFREARLAAYDLVTNNCEHFARYVASGSRESKQVQAWGWVLGITAACLVLSQLPGDKAT